MQMRACSAVVILTATLTSTHAQAPDAKRAAIEFLDSQASTWQRVNRRMDIRIVRFCRSR